MSVLSFQSRICWGEVGNVTAEFALRRLGRRVASVDTVLYSNHPGYGRFRGRVQDAAELALLVRGLDEIGVLAGVRAVLSGYLGSAANGRVVLQTVARVGAAAPGALYCCDPVIGDREEGVYVAPELIDFFRDEAVPRADIVTPNHFELETLAGGLLPELPAIVAAARALQAAGPRQVLVSSLQTRDLPPGLLGTLLLDGDAVHLVTTPRLPLLAKGAGDLLAALFLAHRLDRPDAPVDALARAVASTHAVIAVTVAAGSRELLLTRAQDALVQAPVSVSVVRLA